MKKILIILGMSLLFSCTNVEKKANVNEYKKVLTFYTLKNEPIYLKSNDYFETAMLEIDNDKIELKRLESASGIMMDNKKENTLIYFTEHKVAGLNRNNKNERIFERELYYRKYLSKNNESIKLAKISRNEIVLFYLGKYEIMYLNFDETKYVSAKEDIEILINTDNIIMNIYDMDGNITKIVEFIK